MSTQAPTTPDELQIQALIDRATQAMRDKDVGRFMAVYADDIRSFDVAPPLQFRGAASYRKNLEDWFAAWDGPIDVEVRDLNIDAGSDVAFSTSLNHISGKSKEGDETDVWMRLTLGFRKIDGHWKATHEHVSVPFDMDTQKASLDLKP